MLGLTLWHLEHWGISPIDPIAHLIGTTPPALKLLLSICMAYQIAIFYETEIKRFHRILRQLFLILFGLDMAWFNFGTDIVHGLLACVVAYLTNALIGPGRVNTLITLVFNMLYLLWGYYQTGSEDYDITWTMPHCVLTLKLIALSFDLWDGQKLMESAQVNQKMTALLKKPSIFELFGFVYFPAGFLVGPQFSMKRYLKFIDNELIVKDKSGPCADYAYKRAMLGLLYLILFQVGSHVFPTQYLMSEEFYKTNYLYQLAFVGLWGKVILYKYISCWLLAEASCIRFGLAYQEDSKDIWSACSNIKLVPFECATVFGHYVDSFNVNTNNFAAQYIYKRLKFLGNRYASQLLTLLFLSIWHGLQSGYYMTFASEFIIIFSEKNWKTLMQDNSIIDFIWSSPLKSLVYFFLKMYTIILMGWCLIPFDLKNFSKWWQVYSNLYFSGFIAIFVLSISPLIVKKLSNRYMKTKATKNTYKNK